MSWIFPLPLRKFVQVVKVLVLIFLVRTPHSFLLPWVIHSSRANKYIEILKKKIFFGPFDNQVSQRNRNFKLLRNRNIARNRTNRFTYTLTPSTPKILVLSFLKKLTFWLFLSNQINIEYFGCSKSKYICWLYKVAKRSFSRWRALMLPWEKQRNINLPINCLTLLIER